MSKQQTRDELEAKVNALQRQLKELRRVVMSDREWEEVDTQQDVWSQLEELTDEVDEHSQELAAFDDKDPSTMGQDQRLAKIRQYLVRSAQDKNSVDFGIDYNRVHGLFHGEISESWASQLMKKAAGQFPMDADRPKHGFYYKRRDGDNNEIHVLLSKIEDRSFLRLKNSNTEDTPE